MATRVFTRDELADFGIPYEWEATTPAEILLEHQVDTRRWVSVHEVIFRTPDDGKVWSVGYEQGLTESQDGTDPWGYEDSITATEMEPREVTVTEWVPKGRD